MKQFDVQSFIESNENLFTTLSDQIWAVPELHFNETQSAEIMSRALKGIGFDVQTNVANLKTALVGSYGNGPTVIAFLGEYDALSNLSQQGGIAQYKPLEVGGNGHGCGHNLLGSASFAAAAALKAYVDETNAPVTIRFYGCPAEENGSGKAYMTAAGVFDDVDVALSWHPNVINTVMNAKTLANYSVTFKFTGVSAHAAATPHLGRSALDAVELMNVGVNYLREHIIQEARVHYAVTNSGGTSPNIVQPYAEVKYLIRAPQKHQVQEIYNRVQDIARGAALMTGTTFEEQFEGATSDLIPNKVLGEIMTTAMESLTPINFTEADYAFAEEIYQSVPQANKNVAYSTILPYQKEILGERKLTNLVTPMFPEMTMPASTDVADVSWVTPTVQCVTACWALGTSEHTWQVVSQGVTPHAHKGMLFAAATMAQTAIACIEKPTIIEEAKVELQQRLNGVAYESLIPSV